MARDPDVLCSIPANSKKIQENLIIGVSTLRKCSDDNYKLNKVISCAMVASRRGDALIKLVFLKFEHLMAQILS